MRLSVIATCLSLCMIGFSSADDAHASIRKETHIPAEGLGPALNALAKDRNFQIVYVTEEIANVHTDGAIGEFTTDEALKRLLIGTGLSYHYLNENTITIGSASLPQLRSSSPSDATSSGSSDPSNSNQEAKKRSSGGFRVAQVDQGKSSGTSAVGEPSSSSQENSKGPSVGIEEIVVTAQKRAERVFDVPMSIVAISGDELEKRNITSIDGVLMAVPGVAASATSGFNRQIFIRGVGNDSGNSSLVGLYLDESDVTAFPSYMQPDLQTYDLERVEVLKGPQGTLYGEGSVGGTVRFITKNPQLDTFAMAADVATLYTQDGSPSQRIQSVVNVPLIANELGVRVVGTFDHEGGWIDQPAANAKDINGQNLADVRTKILWQPSSQFTVNAMALVHRSEGGSDVGENANGNYTPVFNPTLTPTIEDHYDIYSVTMNYDFPAARLISATSYIDRDSDWRNFERVLQVTGPPGTTPDVDSVPLWHMTENTFNEEMRLTSTDAGPWQWTVGAMYRHAGFVYNDGEYYFGSQGSPTLDFPTANYGVHDLSRSESVFGDTSYKLTDRLTLGIGLRYFEDDQDFLGTAAYGNFTQTAKFHSIDPRFYVQYKLTDEINTYASASKGFRSGGFNGDGQPTYGPESVWTYELGTKISLDGGRLSFNPAVFYSNYTNYQIYGYVVTSNGGLDVTSNGGDALIKGVEWALDWHPADQWTLSVNGDYMKTAFTKVTGTDTAYDVGDNLDWIPKYQYTLSAQRDFTCNSGKACFARLDYNEQGRETFRDRNIGPWYFSESDVIHMLNFNSGMQMNENLSLGLSVQNLLNDRGFTSPDTIEQYAARSRPRTYGVNFGVKF